MNRRKFLMGASSLAIAAVAVPVTAAQPVVRSAVIGMDIGTKDMMTVALVHPPGRKSKRIGYLRELYSDLGWRVVEIESGPRINGKSADLIMVDELHCAPIRPNRVAA